MFLRAVEEVNSVSNLEFIQIVTTLEILFDPKKTFDCRTCLAQYPRHPQREKLVINNQKSKNCTNDGAVKFKSSHGVVGIGYKRCPGNFYSKWVEHLLSIRERGSGLHQPSKNIELTGLMESIKKALEQREMERYAKHGQGRS